MINHIYGRETTETERNLIQSVDRRLGEMKVTESADTPIVNAVRNGTVHSMFAPISASPIAKELATKQEARIQDIRSTLKQAEVPEPEIEKFTAVLLTQTSNNISVRTQLASLLSEHAYDPNGSVSAALTTKIDTFYSPLSVALAVVRQNAASLPTEELRKIETVYFGGRTPDRNILSDRSVFADWNDNRSYYMAIAAMDLPEGASVVRSKSNDDGAKWSVLRPPQFDKGETAPVEIATVSRQREKGGAVTVFVSVHSDDATHPKESMTITMTPNKADGNLVVQKIVSVRPAKDATGQFTVEQTSPFSNAATIAVLPGAGRRLQVQTEGSDTWEDLALFNNQRIDVSAVPGHSVITAVRVVDEQRTESGEVQVRSESIAVPAPVIAQQKKNAPKWSARGVRPSRCRRCCDPRPSQMRPRRRNRLLRRRPKLRRLLLLNKKSL